MNTARVVAAARAACLAWSREGASRIQEGGWRRILLVAMLVAVLVLVGAGGAGFAAGRVLAGSDGPVRCSSWDVNRCIPGLDLDAVLATLAERGFECERRELCSLAEYRVTFTSIDGQVRSFAASVRVLHDVSLTPRQEAFLSWVAVLPFAGQPASAEAASDWLSEQLAAGIGTGNGNGMNIDGYDYSFGDGGADRLVLEVDPGFGGWFR